MENVLKQIDLDRLTGMTRVLGVDLTEEILHVVELEKHGKLLNRFNASFRVVTSCSYEFDPRDQLEERIKRVRRFILQKTSTKRAVTSLRASGVKTVCASIPQSVESTGEWIEDHYEELIKLPIPKSQITYSYEVLEERNGFLQTEITFIRKEEVEKLTRFFKEIGLELIGLSSGVRDSLNPLLIEKAIPSTEKILLAHAQGETLSLLSYQNGKRGPVKILPVSTVSQDGADETPQEAKFLCGEVEGLEGKQDWATFRPFGLETEYTLAAGLALKGSFPEMNTVDFLSAKERERSEEILWKSLVRRSAISLGVVLFILLAVPFGLSSYFYSRLNALDEEMIARGPEYDEIRALEEQVAHLEARMNGGGATLHRTQLARVLHDVAGSSADSLWLYRITIDETKKEKMTLAGFARSSRSVTAFMKTLKFSGLCSDVLLLRSGIPLQSETLVPRVARHPLLSFEIGASLKEEL